MDDLISRQAAISYAISGRIRTLPTSEDGENWIRTSEVRQSLLTMPPAQQWIPVSEKLPDRVGFYWTTAVGGSGTRTMTSRFFDGTKWERKRRDYTKVVAWMPLPKPYTEVKG